MGGRLVKFHPGRFTYEVAEHLTAQTYSLRNNAGVGLLNSIQIKEADF